MSKEIKEVPVVSPSMNIESVINQAVAEHAPVETIERLLAVRQQLKIEWAKEAFVKAMSKFQSECPIIKKTKKVLNKDGQTVRYIYAPIDSIVEQIKKPLADNLLSYSWNVENKPDMIMAIVTITHAYGHAESSQFTVPIDKDGYMSAPQKYASALTFAKRYSLCNALGISTGDEDTDATDVGKEKNVKSVKSRIVFLLRALGHVTKDREEIKKVVKNLTEMDLVEVNFVDIASRLQVLVEEKNEDKEIS